MPFRIEGGNRHPCFRSRLTGRASGKDDEIFVWLWQHERGWFFRGGTATAAGTLASSICPLIRHLDHGLGQKPAGLHLARDLRSARDVPRMTAIENCPDERLVSGDVA